MRHKDHFVIAMRKNTALDRYGQHLERTMREKGRVTVEDVDRAFEASGRCPECGEESGGGLCPECRMALR